MSLLSLANVSHAFGNHVVLDGVTMSIEPGQKIGLVGRNGSGKTTLMRVLLAQLKPDGGSRQVQRAARIGYLSQDPDFDPTDTVRDAAERAFATLHDLHVQLKDVFEHMAEATGGELEKMMRRQAALEEQIEAAGGYVIDHKIDATLHGLGFPDEQFGLNVQVLSGGQKSRLALAKLLLESPDLLLLDEPTNHLDIDGRQWLENFLAQEYRGAVVLVSHDRWLLDRVVKRVIHIDRGIVREYPGNYSKYIVIRDQQQYTEARTYEKQLDKIRAEEQFIRRYKAGQRSKQAKGRESRLERFKRDELIDRPVSDGVMNLRLPNAPRSGDQVVVCQNIAKRYDANVLFENFNITVMRGDRIGIIGPNGVGKTTLIECLLGELEQDEGTVSRGSRLSIGFYRQLHEHLDLELSVWEYLQSVIVSVDGQVRASEQQARDLAGAFLFSGIEQDKPLGNLSGGERSRAVLAGLVASAKNLLVLDEPTNHLDIPSAVRLEQMLRLGGDYQGTLLLVTHDRALLDATCDKLLIFEGGGTVRFYRGRYTQWAARKDQVRSAEAAAQPRPVRKKRSAKVEAPIDTGLGGLSLSKLEQRIEGLEESKAEIDSEMLDPKVYQDGQRCKALQQERVRLVAELSKVEKEWARRASQA